MIHVIPRKEKDGLNFEIPQKEIPENELEAIRKKLETKLGAVKEEKPKPKIQDLIKPKEQKVVEAEFKEEPKEEKKAEKEKPKKASEEGKQKIPKTKKQSKEDVGLDDISRILGVK